ncbi:siderophore-interacting protein, partial [Burkholderia multivorans]
VWVAGERGLVSAVRHGLRRELPLDRRRHFSQAYWSDRRSAHVPAGESTE